MSQIAKYAKSNFGFTISRVTGLDAAAPLFEECSEEVRIDKSDADFVDLIHTNGGAENEGFLGFHSAPGHADFYPNGGAKQPGCGNLDGQCNHMRAIGLYLDSVTNDGCVFPECSASDYHDDKCNSCTGVNCNSMGFYAQKPLSDTTYFGNTADSLPFC